MILSSCQRLGVAPSAEWQDILAQAFLSTIDTPEKAELVRSDFFVKPLVGLAGMGWKPSPEQWQVVLQASEVLLPLGYFKARQLLETAWAMAQFGTPVPQQWSQVGAGWPRAWCQKHGVSTVYARTKPPSPLIHCTPRHAMSTSVLASDLQALILRSIPP